MSRATSRALLALVKLELRDTVPTSLLAIAAIGAMPYIPWFVTGSDEFARNGAPAMSLCVLVPLVAAVLGGSAVGSERAERTWSFLLSRAVSRGHVLGVKVAVRSAAIVIIFVAVHALARTWTGASAWWEGPDIPAVLGVRLAAMLTASCFVLAFVAGTKLDDPIVASLAGAVVSAVAVVMLLLPIGQPGGSVREALELSPRAWLSAKRAREGCSNPDPNIVVNVPRTAAALVQRDAQGRPRVVIVTIEKGGGPSDLVVLARDTEIAGWEDPGHLRVRFPVPGGRTERSVGLDGRTQPRGDAALHMTDPHAVAGARCDGDRLVLTIEGRDVVIRPRGIAR